MWGIHGELVENMLRTYRENEGNTLGTNLKQIYLPLEDFKPCYSQSVKTKPHPHESHALIQRIANQVLT